MSLTSKEQERLDYFVFLAKQSTAVWWAEKEFGWRPLAVEKDGKKKEAWYQYLLLASCDGIFHYPDDYEDPDMAGKPIRKFAWRIGRQSGKTEILSLTALYLAIKKPIHYTKAKRYKDLSLVGKEGPDGRIVPESGWTEKKIPFVRGAKIIIASADADKARTVFDRVMKFVNESPKFQAAIDEGIIEKKMTPFPELTLHLPGWTEPAWITFRGPGAGGQTARSKTFDYKLYDEADYMPPVFFEAEAATSINAGDNGLTILSSTPTGKRGYFFNACFVEGTPVSIANKKFKAIQDIQIGDEVVNRWGKLEKVTDTMVSDFEGPIVSIKTTKDNKFITATANHRFMAVKKKDRLCKACDTLSFGPSDYCPIYGNHEHLGKAIPEYHQIGDLSLGDFLAIPRELVGTSFQKPGSFTKGEFHFVPISEHYTQNAKVKVYNLTVGNDHSYCVNHLAVANCTDKKLNFQEFHVPSRENPRYTKQFDKGFRASLPMTTYQHEIEADWGTVEEGVFDWTYFEWVFRPYDKRPDPKDPLNEIKTPIYRTFDTKNGTRLKPYPDEYEKISLNAKDVEKYGYTNIGMWLQKRFPPREDGYTYWFGADFGYQADPTELIVFKERNGIMKLIVRIHLEHIEYMLACDIIAFLDTFYQFQALGMDEGSNGVMIKQVLQGKDENGFNKYRRHDFLHRLHAVNFSQTVDIIDNFTKDAKKVPVKQFMTDLIIMGGQNKQLIMPCTDMDTDLENQFRNHTYSTSSNGIIVYSKSTVCPDHAIDAIRTAYWAKAQLKRPAARKWPVGNAFRSRSSGSWK